MTGVMERALVAAQKGELSSDQLLAVLAAGEVWVPLISATPRTLRRDPPDQSQAQNDLGHLQICRAPQPPAGAGK